MKIFVLPYKSIWGVKAEPDESYLLFNSSRSKAIEEARNFISGENDEIIVLDASGEISDIIR